MAAPRIRTLKPEMWQDEGVGALSHSARLTLLGLITMADDEGRLRGLPQAILGHCFPSDDGVSSAKLERWITEIEAQGTVLQFSSGGRRYIAFRHWRRHQRVNRPTPSELPDPPDPVIVEENAIRASDGSRIAHGSLTERSVNDHGAISDRSSLPRVPIRSDPVVAVHNEQTSQSNSELDARAVEVDRLCELFSELLRERTETPASSGKHRVTARWRTEMRRLIERDGRDPAEIEAAIRWVDQDPFWSSNVLSVPTLRKQYDRLRLRARNTVGGQERPASVSELLDRAAAIRAEGGVA